VGEREGRKEERVLSPVLQTEPEVFPPLYTLIYQPVPQWPPPLADPPTDSEPEDSGDPSYSPLSGVSVSPPAQSRAHPKTHSATQVDFQMPLRETRRPMWYNKNGELQGGRSLFIDQPFNTMDLLNW
jgi:hypothetical protein